MQWRPGSGGWPPEPESRSRCFLGPARGARGALSDVTVRVVTIADSDSDSDVPVLRTGPRAASNRPARP